MKPIAPTLYTFDGLIMGRVYLITDDDGLTIIDGGIGLTANRIMQQITAAGYKMSDVKRILLTHAHPDHVGALPELKAQSGAPLITSAVEKPYAQGDLPIVRADPAKVSGIARLMLPKSPPSIPHSVVEETVTEGDVIDVLGGLEVITTPGHSPGHISFYQPVRKILIVGDVMMHLLGGLRLPLAAYTADMDENKRSIQKLAALDVEIVCFGHGAPVTQNANALLRAFAARHG